MMCLILRKGLHKDKFRYNRIVGVWRHKDWTLCAALSLAMELICQWHKPVFTRYNHIHWPDKTKPAMWHTHPLFNWFEYKDAYGPTIQLYKEVGIEPTKVTHHRKQGMDYGSSHGVSIDECSTMSKHTVEKWS